MLKPIYVVASNRAKQSGWYIADASGAVLPDGQAYADKSECYRAIARLS
ncbi:hypothetical protein Q8W71_24825 [Methylobacterium sp. NEAU 140]|nr:hypothetical protein [Methylobacterium sp. NEAU 140]MDP4025860.1 hypothetical protein [Methylobacterium sp. NEAU 140]